MFLSKMLYLAVLASVILTTIDALDVPSTTPKISTDLSSLEGNNCAQPIAKSNPRQIQRLTVSKCCPLGYQLDLENEEKCQPSNHTPLTISVLHVNRIKNAVVHYDKVIPEFTTNFIKTSMKGMKRALFTEGDLFLTSTGSLLEINQAPCLSIDHTRYCIDSEFGTDNLIGIYELPAAEANVMVPTMSISILCLTLTIIVYLIVKRFGDLIGKSLLILSICLLFQYLFYIIKYSSDNYVERMKILIRNSNVMAFYWYTIMWCDITYSVWMYLPHNKHRNKRYEWYWFLNLTVSSLLVIFILSTTNVLSTMITVYHILLGLFLVICLALMIASIIGLNRLDHAMETDFLIKQQARTTTAVRLIEERTFDKEHIDYIRMMFWGAAYLLAYLFLCMIIKLATKSDIMVKTFELFNGAGGCFIFAVFICLPEPTKIIREWWGKLDEGYFLKKFYQYITNWF